MYVCVYCATYIQADQDLRVPLWYRAPLDHPRNIGERWAMVREQCNTRDVNIQFIITIYILLWLSDIGWSGKKKLERKKEHRPDRIRSACLLLLVLWNFTIGAHELALQSSNSLSRAKRARYVFFYRFLVLKSVLRLI